ncbi:hypothetical protein ABIA03_006137 [Bradyrhizobium yuanmingense]|uniref:Uncharacterized protein n=1 Tax=Bradyrhizobium yuanmingense TaxID=108015 RepID=A0ABV4G8H2_9BRAD
MATGAPLLQRCGRRNLSIGRGKDNRVVYVSAALTHVTPSARDFGSFGGLAAGFRVRPATPAAPVKSALYASIRDVRWRKWQSYQSVAVLLAVIRLIAAAGRSRMWWIRRSGFSSAIGTSV